MSGSDIGNLIVSIDMSIADSDERIQEQVARYIELHSDEIAQEIAAHGDAIIPTFAGDYVLTEDQLRRIAGEAPQLEESAR